MVGNDNIVFFGPSDWWGMNPSSGTHIASKLSESNKVLYINPISTDIAGTISASGMTGSLFVKIKRKLKSYLKLIRKENTNLYILSPFYFPIQGTYFWDNINNFLINIQLNLAVFYLDMRTPILWVEDVRAADFLKSRKWKLILFHVSDLFTESRYTKNKLALHARDEIITKNSDLIICVSKQLYKLKKNDNKNVYYLPHGVDFSFFKNASINRSKKSFVPDEYTKVIGYYGTLTSSNDIELLEYCASELSHFYFIFAGQITAGDYSKLKNMKNVKFLGKLNYAEIPALCASFDLCLLPWKMSNWIKHCNPLKLFEYMAAGKPIVSVPIYEVVNNYSEIVSIGKDKEEFKNAILWELKNDNNIRSQKRISIAEKNDWSSYVKKLSEIIYNVKGVRLRIE